MSQDHPQLEEVLKESFGHDAFMGFQREVIELLLNGGDALVLMPTGGGKSLCYQLPALVLDGVTVVLSPLIALMQDQVDQLRARNLPATFINSSLNRAEREDRLKRVVNGEVKLLYVTPERFRKPEFVEEIHKVDVGLLAVDEAHCISSWGHDFRPEYGRVGKIRELLGDPPTVALTATATPDTQEDIRKKLNIPDVTVFQSGIERRNLHIAVRPVLSGEERFERIVEVVRGIDGPGIIYMALIKDLRVMHDYLMREGIEALVYHGDLPATERRRMQRIFIESKDAVIVATNAFGMGVDKPDIRFILHAQIPGSVESYYQEVGRAGREGKTSLCELLYFEEDLMIQKQFVEWGNPDPRFLRLVLDTLSRWGDRAHAHDLDDLRSTLLLKNRSDGRPETALSLLRASGLVGGSFERNNLRVLRNLESGEEKEIVDPDKRKRDLSRLMQMLEFVRSETCHKESLHHYFGLEWRGGPCESCDICEETGAVLESFSPRPQVRAAEGDGEEPPVSRDEWILVDERYNVCVRSVTRRRDRWIIQGQSSEDLKIRSYDLSRVTWRRVDS